MFRPSIKTVMPSLAEVYQRRVGEVESIERLYLGFVVFSFGVLMVFLGGLIGVFEPIGALFGASNPTEQWGLGAVLGGLGIPVALIGIYVVIPTSLENRLIAAAGILTGFLGVAAFVFAYPDMWHNDPVDLTWLVFLIYMTGAVLDLWGLFRSVITIEVALPNNSISLQYTEDNEEPEEQGGGRRSGSTAAFTSIDVDANDAEIMSGSPPKDRGGIGGTGGDGGVSVSSGDGGFGGDRYCGNCVFYDYVRDTEGGGTVPYCQKHDEVLEDLEACEEYEVRTGRHRTEAK